MNYTEKYCELKSAFNPDLKEILLEEPGLKIINTDFTSETLNSGLMNNDDIPVNENMSFSYPVFVPPQSGSKRVILLLHGLNERSWLKYLAWAYYLSLETNSYVILFPISFHINRSPDSWKNPRALMDLLRERKTAFGEIKMSTFANIALSRRLTEDPKRFFTSGYQTACDIVKLMLQIKSGKHKVIPKASRVNIFAYSIGAFLAQILMMGNPEDLFSQSKLFMFCGGSVFSNMQGTSKLIMDSLAYNKVYNFYLNDFEDEIAEKSPLADFLNNNQIGMAFRSMIDLERFRTFRENILSRIKEQIFSVALSGDLVIPAKGIVFTMGSLFRSRYNPVEVWDLPYPYSHENPFPLFSDGLSRHVDVSFERVFTSAKSFLG